MLYCIIQFKNAYKIHEKCLTLENYYLSRYEDLVQDPKTSVRNLCRYIDVPFKMMMLNPPSVDSSYGDGSSKKMIYGFNKSSINKWENNISTAEKYILKIVLKKEMYGLGYK